MIQICLLTVAAILALLGLCEVLHGICLLFIAPKRLPKAFSVVCTDSADPVRQLHYAGNAFSWSDPLGCRLKIAVCDLPAGERREECRRIAERYDMILCSPEMLGRIIETVEPK